MQHTTNLTAATALGATDRADVLLGRADWAWPDYVRAGGEEFDRTFTASRAPYPGERRRYAQVFAELNCPPAKRSAWVAQQRAAFEADLAGSVAA